MYASDITDYGYKAGTFKLGQTVYCIHDKIYRFRFQKKCMYCDNTGKVLIKNREFKCPECHGGKFESKIVREKVTSNPIKIRSVMTFKNRNKSLEVYSTDSEGYGLIIRKQNNGENLYFGSKEEAQEICDLYNKENNINLLLEEYRCRENK